MAARGQHRTSTHSNVAEACDALSGISLQLARKCLYLSTSRKALFHLLAVLLLSLLAAYVPLRDDYYLVKKENILNSYFVKLGWFWTCVVVCPFIWYVSNAKGESLPGSSNIITFSKVPGISAFTPFSEVHKHLQDKHLERIKGILQHLSRMLIATAVWYYCTHGFLVFEQMTGHCHGSKLSPRSTCTLDGGKWVPGFDISGHCFILIYSILIMCEESLAFRSVTVAHRTRSTPPLENENLIRVFFLCMCALHLLWDFELLVSVLYYHHVYQKVLGALIAVFCWYFTYHIWYRKLGIPPPPAHSQKVTR